MADNAYPFPGYNFCVYMDALKTGFRSVSGLTLKKDSYTAFHEGGDNFSIAVHREEKKEPNRLVLSKGVGTFNPAKFISKVAVLLLVVHDEHHQPIHAYFFTGAYVEQVVVSDFDAEQSRVLIDTATIIYDSATEVDISGRTGVSAYLKSSGAGEDDSAVTSASVERIRQHNEEIRKKRAEQHDSGTKAPIER